MTTILCDLSDANRIINEERDSWVRDVLDALNIPEEIYDLKSIDEYRGKMEELGLEVLLSTNGNVDIYKKIWHNGPTEEFSGWLPITDECLIAQWKQPNKIIKVEGRKSYYEIRLNEWSAIKK